MLEGLKSVDLKIIQNESLLAKIEKIYGMHKLVGLQLFWSGTPTFSSGTPTVCQMGVLDSCFQNPSESSDKTVIDFNCGRHKNSSNLKSDIHLGLATLVNYHFLG